MTGKKKTLLVTSALPYANGPIHIGHLVEYIQTDIWVRFQKMQGHACYYVCADDAHGTPIMLRAKRQDINPETLIEQFYREHKQDFADFYIEFDNFYSTHTKENYELVCMIYQRLREGGHINWRAVRQAYDPTANMFLPDRFIQGQCPRCEATDQYGDNCEVCGATYNPDELINPVSMISGTPPISKESEHLFFKLNNFAAPLRDWLRGGRLQEQASNKLDEWFANGLREWDISRDAPYFGFEIPDAPGKYFYVWMDAPIGYLASIKNLADQRQLDFDSFIDRDSDIEMHHFIGKDIIYFHALFWPALLMASGLRTPSQIHTHGFLTVNGRKMSKSRGTFINARTYLQHLDAEYLRYYFAAKLGSGIDDIDLNMTDFRQRINADLVGKLVNIASRCAGFIEKQFDQRLSATINDHILLQDIADAGDSIAACYAGREYAVAMRKIMALADKVNQYIDEKQPWIMAKESHPDLHDVCTTGLNLFRILMIYIKPVLPVMATRIEQFLAIDKLNWEDRYTPLLTHKINSFQPLMTRIEQSKIDAMMKQSHRDLPTGTAPQTSGETKTAVININDFAKIDLRIGKIIEAQYVEDANKLLRLIVDIGDEKRTIFAGIKSSYTPQQLLGRHTVVVANLAPRKMRFGISEGMILAAGEDENIFILGVDEGAVAGMRVK